jgi:hypothetical protein
MKRNSERSMKTEIQHRRRSAMSKPSLKGWRDLWLQGIHDKFSEAAKVFYEILVQSDEGRETE